MKPQFCIGTIKNPIDSDSHAWRGEWSVNCINMWVATLGQNLNPENAVYEHTILIIHEITHALSEEQYCWTETNPYAWDEFIKEHIMM